MDLVFRDPRFATPRLAPSADKMLIWKLSNLGDIVVSRNISIYYRIHHESTMSTLNQEDALAALKSDSEMSLEISQQAARLEINAFQDWQDTYNSAVNNYGLQEFIAPGTECLRNFLNPESMLKPSRQTILRRKLKRLVHLLVPPLIPWVAGKIRSGLVQP